MITRSFLHQTNQDMLMLKNGTIKVIEHYNDWVIIEILDKKKTK